MYCVRRGQVEVIGDDGITVVATLGPGSHFGEVKIVSSLCFLHTRTTVTFFIIISKANKMLVVIQ